MCDVIQSLGSVTRHYLVAGQPLLEDCGVLCCENAKQGEKKGEREITFLVFAGSKMRFERLQLLHC